MIIMRINGSLQGVGMRPFICNLARKFHINGFVRNDLNGLEIGISLNKKSYIASDILRQVKYKKIDSNIIKTRFYNIKMSQLRQNDYKNCNELVFIKLFILCINNQIDGILAPHNALIKEIEIFKDSKKSTKFCIKKSSIAKTHNFASIALDFGICNSCKNDLFNKKSRFYLYPFCACATCGARYSIIKNLPYDRKNTSMDEFIMCKSCKKDYENFKSRRYHAQPISCNNCKINVFFHYKNSIFHDLDSIKQLARALIENEVVIFKGLSGFAFIANAKSATALHKLRDIKKRKSKPFCIMAPIKVLEKITILRDYHKDLLSFSSAPILIAQKSKNYNLHPLVSNLNTVGIMLPYTPMLIILFHILRHDFLQDDFAIVYTSANIKGQMIAASKEELSDFKDLPMLDYDRKIINRADDSIIGTLNFNLKNSSFISNGMLSANATLLKSSATSSHDSFYNFLRISRGFAPLNLTFKNLKLSRKILSFGAMQKSSIALGFKNHATISAYLGDLDNVANINNFNYMLDFLSKSHKIDSLVCDKFSAYTSAQIAKEMASLKNITLHKIYHHHAHYNALMLESGAKDSLGVIFDGTGLGEDNSIWGGEFLSGDFHNFKREMCFKPFLMLSEDIKNTAKLLLGFAVSNNLTNIIDFLKNHFSSLEFDIFLKRFEKNINVSKTSSVGRLFDIVGFFIGIFYIDYEGHSGEVIASLALEKKDEKFNPYNFRFIENEIFLDINAIFLDFLQGKEKSKIAIRFLDSLAFIIVSAMDFLGVKTALFGGGVFANYMLNYRIKKLMIEKNLHYFFPTLPQNDYCISLGQLAFLNDK